MPVQSTSEVVRDILKTNLTLDADQIVRKAKARGVKASDESIRNAVYNVKGEFRKAGKVIPSANHTTTPPSLASSKPAVPTSSSSTKPVAPTFPAVSGLACVFANVTLVNTVVGSCGGLANARAVAEAVNACGGVDGFLQHLDLVAGIRSDKTS